MRWFILFALCGLGMACQQVYDESVECLKPDNSLLAVDTQCLDASYIRGFIEAEYRLSSSEDCPPDKHCSFSPLSPSGDCNTTYCPFNVVYDPTKRCPDGLPARIHYIYVRYNCFPSTQWPTIKLCENNTIETSHLTLMSSSFSQDGEIYEGECRCSLTVQAGFALLIRASLISKNPPSSSCDQHVLIQGERGNVSLCDQTQEISLDCQESRTTYIISYNTQNKAVSTQFSIYLATSNKSPFIIQCGLPLTTTIPTITTSTKATKKFTTSSGPGSTVPTQSPHGGDRSRDQQLDLGLVIGVCVGAAVIIIIAIVIIVIYIRKRKKPPAPGISRQSKSADNIYTVDANKNSMTTINEEDDMDSLEGPQYSNNFHPSEGMNAYELMQAATIRIKGPDVIESSEL